MTRRKRQSEAVHFTDDPLWYKDAVIYQLHIKSYFDGNNDGVGDFTGLIEKLDYIASLGVNTIWLLPFYPSPRRDDGYDIADYRGVHPDYGTLTDAREFIREAHRRGLRVVTELVVNHTSDQHPWFQRARRSRPGSNARNFYVWSDTDQKYAGTRIIFLDTEKSNWTWDPVANSFYWHRFYSHQPDLNFENPRVLKMVLGTMRYWLDMGVDGLRLDAVPYLLEREGTNNENLPETHDILKKIRAEIDQHYPDRMLLAEANQWPEDVQEYFGQGDECHMAFHFPLMPRIYMALAQEDRFPVTDILRQTPEIPTNCQWAIFLRNHDELTLEMVTDKERDYLWEYYAADRRARLNLGIRRRLAPLVERDRRRIELLNSLLLSMPGTPVVYYGDEIGMGDNIYLGDRDGVRTPMQWSMDRNGGFSRADASALVLPPILDPLYGYPSVNVENQSRDPHSILNWMRRMLSIRKRQKAFGRGTIKLIYPRNRCILAYLREFEDTTLLCVANVSRSAQAVELDLAAFAGRVPVEMVGGAAFPPIGKLPYLLTLQPYGFLWFELASEAHMPTWHTPAPEAMPELQTLVIRREVSEVLEEPTRGLLEKDALPTYLPKRRWFATKDEAIQDVHICRAMPLPKSDPPILLADILVKTAKSENRYAMPFGFVQEEHTITPLPLQLALARLRRGRHVGFLTDGFFLPAFARTVLRLLRESVDKPSEKGSELHFIPTSLMGKTAIPEDAEIRWMSAEQSNSSLIVGEVAMIKLIRRISGGMHPEAEMGRTLTERGYKHIAPLLGEVTRVAEDGTPFVFAVVQGFIHNQGDAWSWTQNMLNRAIQNAVTPAEPPNPHQQSDSFAEFAQFASLLGKRLGELHRCLEQTCDDAAFNPEPVSESDAKALRDAVERQLEAAFEVLSASREWANPDDKQRADSILAQRKRLGEAVKKLAAQSVGAVRTRTHGDLHLGQILVAQGDVHIIDFEGEPARPLEERRAKMSPLRDVAGMLRSFDYAAAMASRPETGSQLQDAGVKLRDEICERFRTVSLQAFRVAYDEAEGGGANGGAGEKGREALVELFELEKVAYEICYEAANRPKWLPVPLRGLAAILDREAATETHDG